MYSTHLKIHTQHAIRVRVRVMHAASAPPSRTSSQYWPGMVQPLVFTEKIGPLFEALSHFVPTGVALRK